MRIAFVIYDGFTALDLVGPYEVMARWPDSEVQFVASELRPIRADMGLTVTPTHTPDTLVDPDVVLVPGASNPVPVMQDSALLEWVKQVSTTATWMTSVCTGAGLYAAAGLLNGRSATTHWAFREGLTSLGVTVSDERVVYDGNYVSGAGVSAGIDVALSLTSRVYGEGVAKAIQLVIEYDPQPPFSAGAVEKASAATKEKATTMLTEALQKDARRRAEVSA
jgi:transcriptional regulator GlxA family with amidase domain